MGKPNDPTGVNRISAREKEIVRLLARGFSAREIGEMLNLSDKTVDVHRMNAMRKLDVHKVTGLVIWALHNRLVSLDELVLCWGFERAS